MPGQELHCSGILKTHSFFFESLHCHNKFVSFLIRQFTDLRGNAGGCCFLGGSFQDNTGSFGGVGGSGGVSTSLFAGAIPGNVALLIAFEAVALFPVFFFVCFGDGFLSCSTGVHRIWIPWGELLYWGSSWVLGPLVLLLSSALSLEEGIMGHISCLHWWWSGCGRSIFGSLKTLN